MACLESMFMRNIKQENNMTFTQRKTYYMHYGQ